MKGKTTEKEKLEAVNAAVDECIQKGILRDILIKNHAEVVAMSFWEYDAERHLKVEKQDSYEEGFQKGREREQINTLREKERADAEKSRADAEKSRADTAENRADAAENRAAAAEQELFALKEELQSLRSQLAGSN